MRTVDEVTVPQPGLKLPITALKEITMNSSIQTAQRVPLAFLAAILLTCIWAISTAFAHDQLRSETVKYQDLNVNTSEGIEALYRRIHAAAWRVCSTTSNDPIYQRGVPSCAKAAEAKAVETVNLPQLTALFR